MDPIKNTGSDYVMAMSQTPNNPVPAYADYTTMPVVYEPEMEEKKKASSNMLGMTAVGVLAAVVGLGIGHKWGSKNLKEVQALAEDASNKYNKVLKDNEILQQGKKEADSALENYRTMNLWDRFVSVFKPNSKISETEVKAREAAIKAKDEAAKAEKAAEKEAKKETEKAAEKAAEKTEKN